MKKGVDPFVATNTMYFLLDGFASVWFIPKKLHVVFQLFYISQNHPLPTTPQG